MIQRGLSVNVYHIYWTANGRAYTVTVQQTPETRDILKNSSTVTWSADHTQGWSTDRIDGKDGEYVGKCTLIGPNGSSHDVR